MYSNYSSLYNQRYPNTPAFIDNRKFLPSVSAPLAFPPSKPEFTPKVQEKPLYLKMKNGKFVVEPKEEQHQTCTNKQVCSAWKNDPTYWGPHLWYYLHYSTMNYPKNPTPQQAHEMEDWLCKLPITIPCDKCKYHYDKYIQSHRPELKKACQNGDELFNFLVDVHNQVNKRNNKPVLSYEEARKLYK